MPKAEPTLCRGLVVSTTCPEGVSANIYFNHSSDTDKSLYRYTQSLEHQVRSLRPLQDESVTQSSPSSAGYTIEQPAITDHPPAASVAHSFTIASQTLEGITLSPGTVYGLIERLV